MANINGLDKAQVLAALYNAARAQGMGFMHYDPTPMTVEEARSILERTSNFDYVKGRVMKIEFKEGGDDLDTTWYNRDNGEGSAEMVIDTLRAGSDVNNRLVQKIHEVGLAGAIQFVRQHMSDKSSIADGVVSLGLGDMAEFLNPKVQEAQDMLDERQENASH